MELLCGWLVLFSVFAAEFMLVHTAFALCCSLVAVNYGPSTKNQNTPLAGSHTAFVGILWYYSSVYYTSSCD